MMNFNNGNNNQSTSNGDNNELDLWFNDEPVSLSYNSRPISIQESPFLTRSNTVYYGNNVFKVSEEIPTKSSKTKECSLIKRLKGIDVATNANNQIVLSPNLNSYIYHLPPEILQKIINETDICDMLSLKLVSRKFYKAATNHIQFIHLQTGIWKNGFSFPISGYCPHGEK